MEEKLQLRGKLKIACENVKRSFLRVEEKAKS
jgi:hypothetical protein